MIWTHNTQGIQRWQNKFLKAQSNDSLLFTSIVVLNSNESLLWALRNLCRHLWGRSLLWGTFKICYTVARHSVLNQGVRLTKCCFSCKAHEIFPSMIFLCLVGFVWWKIASAILIFGLDNILFSFCTIDFALWRGYEVKIGYLWKLTYLFPHISAKIPFYHKNCILWASKWMQWHLGQVGALACVHF